MIKDKRVLIAGMGVAGLAIARLLHQDGYQTTVVERASSFRMGGQPVDVRGAALSVLAHMGLLEQARAAKTYVRGMSIVDSHGVEIERNTEWTLGTGQLESPDIELLRDDLMHMLRNSDSYQTEEIFGDAVSGLLEMPDEILVSFRNGPTRAFDLVIGADGLHSSVRKITFGPDENFLKHMNKYLSVFTGPNSLDLDHWQLWYRSEDANYLAFPIRNNSLLRVGLWFNSAEKNKNLLPVSEQKQFTYEHMKHVGGHAPTFLQMAQNADDFYCSPIAQIHIEHYARGRVVLLGDAAYSASPFSGQGTSLALVGAYILASELRSSEGNFTLAFSRYECRMKPFVALNQGIVHLDRSSPEYLTEFQKAVDAISL